MNIIKRNSPNQGSRNGWKPDMIVCHITEGSYSGAVSWLCNPVSGVSANFVVSQKGEVTQLVDIQNMAWCNGTSTDPSSRVYYGKSSLELVRSRKTNANYYTISIEFEGFWNKTKGKLTSAQFKAAVELMQHIRSEVKRIYGITIPVDRQHIVGHFEISPVTRPYCPGEAFQFEELIQNLSGEKTGWIQQEGKWWYRHADGSYTKNGWEKISGEWYYFDEEGWMKTGWIQYKGGWYCCAENGKMYVDTWKMLDGKWYVFDANGKACEGWYRSADDKWYYMKPGTCEMLKGWLELDGRWYYLSPKAFGSVKEGEMVKGNQTIDGKVYQFAEKSEGNVKEGQMIN